jgi:alpha-beta hydrolase superfamily lysophospholipase
MTQHHEHVPLKDGCFAMISDLAKPNRAVVFVHGWGGSPETTWYHFQEAIDENYRPDVSSWWREADLYFYSYESRRFSIAEHTEAFLRFLDQIFPVLSTSISQMPDQWTRTSDEYSELYLVGHSLGGVVLREAILDRVAIAEAPQRASTESTVLLKGELRLFAPAMHGAKPSGWLGLTYFLLGEIRHLQSFLKAAAESQTIIRQLKSESDKLVRLRNETEKLAGAKGYRALVAHVVYGEKEHIVERDKFLLDKIALPIPGKNHRSICKPDNEYTYPLLFVIRGKDA